MHLSWEIGIRQRCSVAIVAYSMEVQLTRIRINVFAMSNFPETDRFRESLSRNLPIPQGYGHLNKPTPSIFFGKVTSAQAEKR